jgi:hypothetical protein
MVFLPIYYERVENVTTQNKESKSGIRKIHRRENHCSSD